MSLFRGKRVIRRQHNVNSLNVQVRIAYLVPDSFSYPVCSSIHFRPAVFKRIIYWKGPW